MDLQTGKPVAFATLVLYKKIDSTKKITQVADKNGAFEFEKLSFGYYRLTFTAIGFYGSRSLVPANGIVFVITLPTHAPRSKA